jgi:hypothetical protein
MITSEKYINYIVETINVLRQEIVSRNKMGLTDHNIHIENFACYLLNEIFSYQLINLNSEQLNNPGIDLGDLNNGIGIQVTATKTSAKINSTLKTIFEHKCYEKYPKIKFFITTYKQEKYTAEDPCATYLNFSTDSDILDFDDLYKRAMHLDIAQQKNIAEYIQKQIPYVNASIEVSVRHDGGLPVLPSITMFTMEGVSIPSTRDFTVTSDHVERVREHVLLIENQSGRILSYFQARIQLPEPIVHVEIFEQPPGETIECKSVPMPLMVVASGGGSVSKTTPSRPPFDFNLRVGSLPPRSRLEIHFSSMRPEEFSESPPKWNEEEDLLHFIGGDFQYPVMGEYMPHPFLVILNFDGSTRTITSSPCEDFDDSKQPQKRTFFW